MKGKIARIAIFASGNGSNAENIVRYFRERNTARVDLIVSNNANAFVLERAANLEIESKLVTRKDFKQAHKFLDVLKEKNIDFIVLAGFLWLIPVDLITAFPQKIINIHPALLPKFGGKGMYGDRVHQAVSDARETESGISIHYVNQAYDEGDIVFQKSVYIKAGESPDKIAEKVHSLEYEYYPQVIEQLISTLSH